MTWTVISKDPAPGVPTQIRSLAEGWRAVAARQRVAADDLDAQRRSVPSVWRDASGADALMDAMSASGRPLTAVADELTAVAALLSGYADELEAFQRQDQLLRADLGAAHARLDSDANTLREVVSPIALVDLPGLARAEADLLPAQRALDDAARGLTDLAVDAHAAAVRTAAQIHAAAATLEASVVPGGPSLGHSQAYDRYLDALAARRPPDLPADPAAAAAAWAALDPDLRSRYLTRYPALVGNTAGIPAADRDTANRLVLQGDLATIESRVRAAGFALPTTLDAPDAQVEAMLTAAGYSGAALKTAEGVLVTARQLDRAAASGASPTVDLLVYQPGAFGGKGRAAIAIGDVGTAAHVAVLAPGMTSQVPDYLHIQVDNALALLAARRGQGADPAGEAVVAYIGYDAPGSTDLNVALPLKAVVGGQLLARDIAGFRAAHDGSAETLTLVAHSYGSTTAAYAVMRDHAPVDNLVLIGSPGAGPATSAADFGLLPGHVFVGAASGDPVTTEVQQEGDPTQASGLPVRAGEHLGGILGGTLVALTPLGLSLAGFKGFSLGADPAGTAFGATRFHAETGNTDTWHGDNHSEYYRPGSESLDNIAAIVGGEYDQVGVAPGRPETSGHYQGVDPETGHVPPR